VSSLPAPIGQQQLASASAPRRAFFGLFDAAGWGWASFRAVLWTLFIILMLGYIPDRAYYIVTSPTIELGLNAASLVNICPGENKDLPCPAPAGALIPWEGGAPVALPGAGEGGSLLQVGTHLYYLGGRASGALDDYANTPSVAAAAIGPEGLSTWSAVAPLPAPRALSAAAYLAGTAYVIGGTSDSESATTTVFTGAPDPVTGTIDAWMLADALELPAPRTAASVVTVSDGLIVFGGANEFYVPQTNVWKSTLQSNGSLGPWEEMAPLPEPRANAAAALVGDSVWIWGGRDASGYTGVSLHGASPCSSTAPAAARRQRGPSTSRVMRRSAASTSGPLRQERRTSHHRVKARHSGARTARSTLQAAARTARSLEASTGRHPPPTLASRAGRASLRSISLPTSSVRLQVPP
jgi:hypothetical protein